jgi:hypothetical protein
MPIGTAVHDRTFALAGSLNYREWSGYYAVSAYETHHEHEYNAIRNASALIDVSPLFKYLVRGRDAVKLVDRVITRDAFKLAIGQVFYTPWCDEHGKVIDDGTVTRLDEDTFRWTAADPSLRWLSQNAIGLDVAIEDISEQVAALALQGPTSGKLLDAVADADIKSLKYFRMTRGAIAGVPVDISRTGYTGDLGYEIWMPWDRATAVWDALMFWRPLALQIFIRPDMLAARCRHGSKRAFWLIERSISSSSTSEGVVFDTSPRNLLRRYEMGTRRWLVRAGTRGRSSVPDTRSPREHRRGGGPADESACRHQLARNRGAGYDDIGLAPQDCLPPACARDLRRARVHGRAVRSGRATTTTHRGRLVLEED